MFGKVIAGWYNINFGYLNKEGFSIGKEIRATGYESFCSTYERYYPYHIREFYGSMTREGEGWVEVVRRVQIPVMAEVLS